MKKHIRSFGERLRGLGVGRIILALTAAFLVFIGIIIIWVSTMQLPTLDSFGRDKRLAESTKIYDRTGEVVLYDVFENVKRTVIPFEEMPETIKEATIAIEDDVFYQHKGVRPLSFIRAALVNVGTMEFSQGGSTITQQVVKNTVLSSEKTVTRKIKEWILALRLEQMLSKNEILNLYLNVIPYGGSVYGIEEASHAFYGKKASELSLAEAAYLAALPQAPTYYSPYGSHRDKLEERKNLVLRKMLELGYINQEEHDTARAQKIEFKKQEDGGIKAPHFVMYVREYLAEKYGEDAIQERGFRIITTLDWELQQKAEEIAKKYALENKTKFNAENAAFVAMDPKTGHILAMVGSRDYFDEEIDGNFNVAVASNRQPGSTFKPFAYAQAFNKGYTPDTILFDLPTEFSTTCNPDGTGEGCYMPKNYDNAFRGPMTMRNALAQSINVPAVKTLYLAGIRDTLRLARDMGVTSLKDPDKYGLTLVLGGGEVSLLEMTGAYTVFANKGVRNPHQSIIEIKDRGGNVIESFEEVGTQVLPENTALMITDILSDNVARIPAYGESSLLFFPGRDVAVKTGTTNDYRDAWIIGYTPNIVIGAWAGNNDNRPMEKRVAGFIVAPMWRALMDEAMKTREAESFTKPIMDYEGLKPVLRGQWHGGQSYWVDKASGKLATEETPEEFREERFTGDVHSILFWVTKDDPRGPYPANPSSDSQFEHWEYAVQAWAQSQGIVGGEMPTETDDVHNGDRPEVSFRSPEEDRDYDRDNRILVRVDVESETDIEKVEYYLNGRFIGSADSSPWSFSFTPGDFEFVNNENRLRAVAIDEVGNKGSETMSFRLKRRGDDPIEGLLFENLD